MEEGHEDEIGVFWMNVWECLSGKKPETFVPSEEIVVTTISFSKAIQGVQRRRRDVYF